MADLCAARSALADAYAEGSFGVDAAAAISFAERRNLVMVQVSSFAETATEVSALVAQIVGVRPPSQPNTVACANGSVGPAALLWTGPDRWLVVAPGKGNATLATRLEDALPASGAAVTDLSSARTVVRVSGYEAGTLLAKDCGLDFHPRSFGVGTCAQTLIGDIGALIHRIDDAVFDVFVARSYALDFWQLMTDAAREFGYHVLPPIA
jgi:sarcosine oxidase subunit gamma